MGQMRPIDHYGLLFYLYIKSLTENRFVLFLYIKVFITEFCRLLGEVLRLSFFVIIKMRLFLVFVL